LKIAVQIRKKIANEAQAMPYKRGAPAGNTNRLKHGRYRAAALAHRKFVREIIRSARLALAQGRLEISRLDRVAERMDKNT
jgi:hypothetical protein